MKTRAALALMAASGFAALGYQMVWTQQSALWLGQEGAAMLAVITAFFAGLALGSITLGRRIERSAHPARWYAACEAAIGVWGLALAVLLQPATAAVLDVIGAQPSALRHWSLAFASTFVALLPATAAMGATLPALERALATLLRRPNAVSAAYAANTLGAVAGALVTAFVLVPRLGLAATASVCAALNFGCAALALALLPASTAGAGDASAHGGHRPLALLAATGFLGIGYEVLVVRVLSQVTESTVYTYAILLSLYLAGTTLGAAFHHRFLAPLAPAPVQDRLAAWLAAACLAGIAALSASVALKPSLAAAFGPGMAAALAAEALLGALAFLPAALVMGALFSHLATRCRLEGVGFARALAANTFAAALAPPVLSVLLVPVIGLEAALLAVSVAYLALLSRQAWARALPWAGVASAGLLAVFGPGLAMVAVPEGGRVLQQHVGSTATVSVVADASGVATLHIDNHQQEGSSATRFADARQAYLPLLLHAAPTSALFLGVGTGVTSHAAARDAGVSVDAVELLPEVIEASRFFTAGLGDAPSLTVLPADARRFVKASRGKYDVIVADNFHPARSGSGVLYTVEHFRAVRERLAPGGVFCQWLPLHQMDLDSLRIVVRTFLEAYPHAFAVLATYSLETPVVGLVARADGVPWNVRAIRAHLARRTVAAWAARAGFEDELAVTGTIIADTAALSELSAGAPLNTDDRPIIAYRAPRVTYQPDAAPRDRLLELLGRVRAHPVAVAGASADAPWTARLAAYAVARNAFLQAGRNVRASRDAARMLSQVREPLLAVLRRSPDFRPAYDPLLRIAAAIAPSDREAARALLAELQALQPARTEAGEMLASLHAVTGSQSGSGVMAR
jgi:spermidine synthase